LRLLPQRIQALAPSAVSPSRPGRSR